MKRRTGYERQWDLEERVTGLIEKHGTDGTVSFIKNSTAEIFSNRQHYPSGVYVYCNSPSGGLMIGTRS
jgi:hypothetical protein